MTGGTLDPQGPGSRFPSVVGVRRGGGKATGTLLSDRVVVTAGHLVADMLSGCAPFAYEPGQPSSSSNIRVRVADASGKTLGGTGEVYEVDAIAGLRRYTRSNAFDCCGGVAAGCDACQIPQGGEGWGPIHAFDLALLHLDRPIEDIEPARFVARIVDGPASDEELAAYPIVPEAWPGNVVATVVGIGTSAPGVFGWRRYGPTAIVDLGLPALDWQQAVLAESSVCDAAWWLGAEVPATTWFECSRCSVDTSTESPLLEPDRPVGQSMLATPGIVWAPAVEARLGVSRGAADDGFHALAFSADGTDVVDGLLRRGLLAGTTGDFARAAPLRPGSPSARHDFVGVFSRVEDRAFVVGGVEDASGVEAGDIWHRAVEGQSPWTRVPLGAHRVGRVLAATWSYVDDRLWVLDEIAATGKSKGKARRVRLYRVEPYLGVVSLVGEWPMQPAVDRRWLVLDLDGQVLLATSSSSAKIHTLARFEATAYDSLAPLGFSLARRPGQLLLPPLADERGYSFVFAGPGGVPELVRRSSLEWLAAGPAELEGAL